MGADIHDGPGHNKLQSEAGYIDARPQSRQIDETSCDARPDHTSGSSSTVVHDRPDDSLSPASFRALRVTVTEDMGRVEMWRGFFRSIISVSAPFVWRCLSGSTVAPFPHPAHRTG